MGARETQRGTARELIVRARKSQRGPGKEPERAEESQRKTQREPERERAKERMVMFNMLSQGAKEAVEMALREEDNVAANFNSDDIPCFGYTIFSDPHVQVNDHFDMKAKYYKILREGSTSTGKNIREDASDLLMQQVNMLRSTTPTSTYWSHTSSVGGVATQGRMLLRVVHRTRVLQTGRTSSICFTS